MSNEQNQVARQQRKRNIAIALVLFGFIVLLYLVTIVRLGG
jgi:hypothetical protein